MAPGDRDGTAAVYQGKVIASAFSVAELLVAFGPIELLRDGQLEDIRWLTRHQYSGIGDMYGYGKTDADSLGNLLIIMIEARKIRVSSVNARIRGEK